MGLKRFSSARRRYMTKDERYEREKQAFLMRYPHATARQYQAFIQELVQRLRL